MRAKMAGRTNSIQDLMRSYTVSKFDRSTGGRHKALGDLELNIIPKTSTISSHWPRVVGLASGVTMAPRLKGLEPVYRPDSVVIGSGGDAGVNHATFQTAANFMAYTHRGLRFRLPTLSIISDNKIGISVPTPEGWIKEALTCRQLPYFAADGVNVFDVYQQTVLAAEQARRGRPTFLHLHVPRLFNHAGSDAGYYQSPEVIAEYIRRDPIPWTIGLYLHHGITSLQEMYDLYTGIRELVRTELRTALQEPKLGTLEEVMDPIFPRTGEREHRHQEPSEMTREQVGNIRHTPTRIGAFVPQYRPPSAPGHRKTAEGAPRIMKQLINQALAEMLEEDPSSVMLGEDIGAKGGNYGVTDRLQRKYGELRVRDTLLDETSILGLGNGLALNGILPVVEICYLAYIHNAIDQLRGEAATLSFFSNGQFTNGFICRISGGGLTQFGGHYHNENSLAPLLDIPGITLVYPSNGADYVRLFRRCREVAKQGRVVVIIEPLRAYAMREFGKHKLPWQFAFPGREEVMALDHVNVYEGRGTLSPEAAVELPGNEDIDLTEEREVGIVTYGNGTWLSLDAQRELRMKHGFESVDVIEVPCLTLHSIPARSDPTDTPLLRILRRYKHVLFADESRISGCPSTQWITSMHTSGNSVDDARERFQCRVGLVAAADCFIPLGQASQVDGLYLSSERIVESVRKLVAPQE